MISEAQTEKENRLSTFDHLPTKSAQIRSMSASGMKNNEIAKAMNIRYQHVRNVLNYVKKK
jgi:DNA-binding NarL/FixJ family response regulator